MIFAKRYMLLQTFSHLGRHAGPQTWFSMRSTWNLTTDKVKYLPGTVDLKQGKQCAVSHKDKSQYDILYFKISPRIICAPANLQYTLQWGVVQYKQTRNGKLCDPFLHLPTLPCTFLAFTDEQYNNLALTHFANTMYSVLVPKETYFSGGSIIWGTYRDESERKTRLTINLVFKIWFELILCCVKFAMISMSSLVNLDI